VPDGGGGPVRLRAGRERVWCGVVCGKPRGSENPEAARNPEATEHLSRIGGQNGNREVRTNHSQSGPSETWWRAASTKHAHRTKPW